MSAYVPAIRRGTGVRLPMPYGLCRPSGDRFHLNQTHTTKWSGKPSALLNIPWIFGFLLAFGKIGKLAIFLGFSLPLRRRTAHAENFLDRSRLAAYRGAVSTLKCNTLRG